MIPPQPKGLGTGRWKELSFSSQMANIGSEVSRAFNWQNKNKKELSQKAIVRGLALIDLSLACGTPLPRLRELTRVREALIDFFFNANAFASSERLWRKYFDHFAYAVRKNH